MVKSPDTMAQQVSRAVSQFQRELTGHAPQSVSVVLGEGTMVATLHGALSPAERALTQRAEGAAQVQEFYRQLFANSAGPLWEEIKRITGVAVSEAAAVPTTAQAVHAFVDGTLVQVFLMSQKISFEAWNREIVE